MEFPLVQNIDKIVDVRVVMQRRVSTVELPQVWHTEEIVDVTVVRQHQAPTTQTVHKMVEVHLRLNVLIEWHICQLCGNTQYQPSSDLDRLVGVPVAMKRQTSMMLKAT